MSVCPSRGLTRRLSGDNLPPPAGGRSPSSGRLSFFFRSPPIPRPPFTIFDVARVPARGAVGATVIQPSSTIPTPAVSHPLGLPLDWPLVRLYARSKHYLKDAQEKTSAL